jgi:outer membrane receptor protein involved in Fe transport
VRGDVRHLSADANEDLELEAQTRDYTAFSGDAGILFRPLPDVAIAANIGRAWRAPTLFELFAHGPQIGEGRFVIGSSDLETESSANVDLSVRWVGRRARVEVAGYRNVIDHYIYLSPTAEVEEDLPVFDYLQANSLLWGGEVTAEVDPSSVLTLRGRADAVRGTNRDLHEPLPLVPPPRAAFETELHSRSLSWADNAYVTAEVEATARQRRPNPDDFVTPGYTLLHAGAGVARRLGGRPTRVDLRVRNLTNARYTSFLSRYKEFALDPGRTVILRLSMGL